MKFFYDNFKPDTYVLCKYKLKVQIKILGYARKKGLLNSSWNKGESTD